MVYFNGDRTIKQTILRCLCVAFFLTEFSAWTSAQNSNIIRLTNGSRVSQGRVEVFHNNTWGTVCDDNFDNNAAAVVCHMLGFTGKFFVARSQAFFGAGSGTIWLDDVTCNGNETSITGCRNNAWGVSNCGHSEDVGVDCRPDLLAQVPVHLVNGSSGSEGRVEVQHGGLWGTICDDEWDDKAANIVCKQLGFNNVQAIPLNNAFFGQGSGNIWLDDVKCTGLENGLGACNHKPWGSSNCQHNEDAGVMCLPKSGSAAPQIQLQLTGGLNIFQGRVEINVFNHWGTICDDGFDDREATVVCRMLGHHRGGHKISGTSFGGGSGPIWLDDMECTGNETTILNCQHKPWGVSNCGHNEDVAVQCIQDHPPAVKFRLAGSNVANQGRVEVQYSGMWGTICDDHWSASDAAVVCRSLGLPFSGAAPLSLGAFGQGTGHILMDNVECIGTEASLGMCKFNGWTINDCDHSEDAAVICQDTNVHTQVRLRDGSDKFQGRVEIFHNNTWGTVCDDSFDNHDAAVICSMLNYPSQGALAKSSAFYGPGSGKIWLDDMNCMGNETDIANCGHRGWGNTNCGHREDAGVICMSAQRPNVTIRLSGGGSSSEGRVEVYHNGSWGTVCDDYIDTKSAAVICSMLGLPSSGAQPRTKAYYGQGHGTIWLDNVKCTGNETSIAYCRHNNWGVSNCGHSEDVGVVCDSATNVAVRVKNGTSTSNGRLEVFYNSTWGTVCDDGFNALDAQVACRMLGYQTSNSIAVAGATYGQGAGPILLDDLECTGSETNIVQCRNKGWYSHNCGHSEDVGVECNAAAIQYRLVNGSNNKNGRVEVKLAGVWGTVCDDRFDAKAAKVVCKALNLPYHNAVPMTAATYGQGTGKIWLDEVVCFGNETSILDCQTNTIGDTDCTHGEDVGVLCTDAVASTNLTYRLRDGPGNNEGRLEVFYSGKWGTVCDDNFNNFAAKIVCDSLGLTYMKAFVSSPGKYGPGSGPIWLDGVTCYGNETALVNCKHNDFGNNDCDHTEDVGVVCATKSMLNFQIKLVNGTTPRKGRVMVNHNGTWGTICDDGWGVPEATVACNQIGYRGAIAVPLANAYYGSGTGSILIDELNCNGNETNLGQCDRKPWGVNDCTHGEDAGLMCLQRAGPPGVALRLAGGLSRSQGRVEIRYRGVWGSICDDSWDNRDANVVCKQLGFSGGRALTGIGTGRGPIWMDDVECTGSETDISTCAFKGWAENDCDHSEDAGVSCNDTTVQNYPVRLQDGPSNMEGRVEVFINGQWGTVCDDHWSNADAAVVCRMLNASTDGATAYGGSKYGVAGGSIYLDEVKCLGTETNIGQCSSNGAGLHNCNHNEDAGVRCYGGQVTSVGIRLRGGSNSNEGRVEVFYNGTWGTICDDNWDNHAAKVVCAMMTLPTQYARARSGGFYSQGTGQIWLDDVNCIGNETSLATCGHRSWGANNCGHSEDAGVICGGVTRSSPVRLMNGTTRAEGRVEIFHNGTWGTICDDNTNRHFAEVICAQLGFSTANVATRGSAFFGPGTGQIWLDDVTCNGDENMIDNCMYRSWGTNNCGHNEDVGVLCNVPSSQVRIVPPAGGSPNQGRVEILYNNTWGTICDDSFDSKAAGVICSQLGFRRSGAQSVGGAHFGQGSGPILLDDVHCLGQETNILQCDAKPWGINNCGHSEDVGVICGTGGVGNIRLVGGTGQQNGRVEVLYNGTWGTVCDDRFSDAAAKVVCGMLHYPSMGAYMLTRDTSWSSPPSMIWLDDVRCVGTETSIANCGHRPWGANNCGHREDVGVYCTATTTPGTTTTPRLPPSTPAPSSVYVRLAGGSTAYEGRVEVFAFNTWGTVCDDQWNGTDANVICGMLGYQSTGATAKTNGFYGQGSGRIWLDNVHCRGTESTISACPMNAWGAHNCGHQEDAGVSCSSGSLPDNFLLFTDSSKKSIYRMDITTNSYVTVPLTRNDRPIAIDYDPNDARIYWTDVGLKQIRSASIDGNEERTVRILGNNSRPDGIAVDSVSRLIFYTDTGNNIIAVMTLDGSAQAVIINQGLDEPRAMFLDVINGKIFWTDWGKHPTIETANYDGSGRHVIINQNIVWPNAISVDTTKGIIYWADANLNRIERANLDGSNRHIIHQDRIAHYFGMTIFQNMIYYTDWTRTSVMKVPITGGSSTPVGPAGFGRLNDIHIHKNGYNPSGVNGCTNGNGGCSHICIPSGANSKKCLCPTGLSLQGDGISCGNTRPCPPLTGMVGGTVMNASCTSGMSQPGQKCNIVCNKGYQYAGNTQLTCYGNGQWSNYGAPLICRDITPPTLNCPSDQILTAVKGKQTVVASWPAVTATDNSATAPSLFQSMKAGMTLTEGVYGVNVMASDKGGLTSSCSFTVTVKVQRCAIRPAPQNGYILTGICADHYGATCMLGCNPGYRLSDSTHNGQISCTLDTNNHPLWTGVGLSCQAITCSQLSAPQHATISGCSAPYSYGSSCQQQCQAGYYRSQGTDSRQCMRDGTWSGQAIVCNNAAGGGASAQIGSKSSSTSSGSSTNVGIVAAVVVGVVFIVLIIGGIFLYLRKMQYQMSSSGGAYALESMSTSMTSRTTGAAGWENPNYSGTDASA